MIVQTEDQKEEEIERRTQARLAHVINNLPPLIETAAERAVRKVLSDTPIKVSVDWEQGYKELERHAGTSMAQAIGRRIVNWIVGAALAAAIGWAVFKGGVK